LALQMKVFVVENSEASIFFPKVQSMAFCPKRAWFGQSGESDTMEKEIV
jgi:hypothetical protein